MIGTLVVGAGPIGASAARHLSAMPDAGEVVVIGPDHPADRRAPAGLFGVWHDEARLTRVIADDDVWATLAEESIDRYPQIAGEGGMPFHRNRGVIYVHEAPDRFVQQCAVARRHRATWSVTGPGDYPYLRMTSDARVIDERGAAGTVNPRVLVANQLAAATTRGARVLRDHVVAVDPGAHGVRVRLANGDELHAERAVVAAGAYVGAFDLVPEPLPVDAVGITALFVELDEAAVTELAAMPGALWYEADGRWLYTVPPTTYPDGVTRFKIGGLVEHSGLRDRASIDEWYRSDGAREVAASLRDWVRSHVPVLADCATSAIGCAITEARSTNPIIRQVAPRVVVATGCGGAAAKSCDEIGRLAAVLCVHHRWDSALDAGLFAG